MVHTYNLGTQEVEVEGLRVQNEPSYNSEFETCLGYVRPYLQKKLRGGGRGGKNHCGLETPIVTNDSVILPFF